jgi:hypothetical protein
MKLKLSLIILIFSLFFSCENGEEEELPQYPVEIYIGGIIPVNTMIGDYEVTLTKGFVVIGDLNIYGTALANLTPVKTILKHAGHTHGEAEFETNIPQTFLINLINDPVLLETKLLTEGHYFDGSLRLRPSTEIYSPLYPETKLPVPETDEIWGDSLLLEGDAVKTGVNYSFKIRINIEAMVVGIEYGGMIEENGDSVITTLINIKQLLSDINFAELSDNNDFIQIDETTNSTEYLELKVKLKDLSLYIHEEYVNQLEEK